MRSEAAATIFSRSNAPPPPLMRLSEGSISSAPSTVRSSRSISSSVVRGMPQRMASARVGFRRRHADDVEPVANPRAKQLDKMLRRRSGTEAEFHAIAHELQRAARRLPFQFFHAHAQTILRKPPPAPPSAMSGRDYLASFSRQEQRHGVTGSLILAATGGFPPKTAPTCMIGRGRLAIFDGLPPHRRIRS